MPRKLLTTAAVGAALMLGTALFAGPSFAHGSGGPMGTGMMGHMGTGMMGHMGSAGPQGCPYHQAAFTKELTIESVTKYLERRLDQRGNDRLKVGEVKVKDDNTIIAEIVTVDDSLVQRIEFDRKTGQRRQVR